MSLTKEERYALEKLLSCGRISARVNTRSRILLMADTHNESGWPDTHIAKTLNISIATIERIRKAFVICGMVKAINGNGWRRLSKRSSKLNKAQEAQLTTLARRRPPQGYRKWTLRLLAMKMVELNYVDSISHVTVRKVLKKRYTDLLNHT